MGTRTDAAGLGAFRILFGLCALWGVLDYCETGMVGLLSETGPRFGFVDWLPQPGPASAPWLVGGLLACLVALTLGLFFRAATAGFVGLYGYVFLLDRTVYNNHHYLLLLLGLVLLLVDAHRWASCDARRRSLEQRVPVWQLALLRLQIVLVYFYAGLAKLDPDWLAGRPLQMWFGPLGGWPVSQGLAWGGLVLDLFAPLGLLYKPARTFTLMVLSFFHLSTAVLFHLDMFPWLMLACLTLFLEPSWPRRLAGEAGLAPVEGRPPHRWLTAALMAYALFQVLFPLRHLAYPGDVVWTGEGGRFAWRMMVANRAGEVIEPREGLTPRQRRALVTHPDLLLEHSRRSRRPVRARLVLNSRPPMELRLNGRLPPGPRRSYRPVDAGLALAVVAGWLAAASVTTIYGLKGSGKLYGTKAGMRNVALLLLLALTWGCAGSREAARLRAYFGEVARYESALGGLQSELTNVQTLELKERPAAYRELAARARQEREQMGSLSVPAEASEYHTLLTELFGSFADFADQAAASHGVRGAEAEEVTARREEAGKRYQELLKQLHAEQEHLSEQHKLKFD